MSLPFKLSNLYNHSSQIYKMRKLFALVAVVLFFSCNTVEENIPVIGFVDAFEDNTITKAKTGFMDALKENGFDEKAGTLKVVYRNAQGNIPVLTQIIQYFNSQKLDLIATCPTLSTITAVQNNKTIPVFMMVSGTPELMHLLDKEGNPPSNLYGVSENLNYIDTSFLLIPKFIKKPNLKVGMVYNQSEPQSEEAIGRIKKLAENNNIILESLPVNSSADVQMVTQALLSKNIDAFFANPDNTVFSSFENIVQACNQANVPIFTSEAGLVSRGAVMAYGADIYQWGYQAGKQAAEFLKTHSTDSIQIELVKVRKKVYNPTVAKRFNFTGFNNFEAIQ